MPSSKRLCHIRFSILVAMATVLCRLGTPAIGSAADAPVTVTDYTDPGQALQWGTRSHWKQPWRSYLETVPATTLLDAIGINFNVPSGVARSTAKLLGDSGFKRARVEVGWNSLDYGDPTQLTPRSRETLETTLTALRENGIRPLLLLNANSGGPCPVTKTTVELTAPAVKGSTTLQIAPADVSKVVPGHTGIRSGGTTAAYLFTSAEPDGTVHLSAPLGDLNLANKTTSVVTSLEAGPVEVETLRYEPFHQPRLADGSPNPAFEPTMQGWLNYVGVVTREAKRILGSEDFDVEIWNELSFGSRFLNINNYYRPALESGGEGAIAAIRDQTVEYLRNSAERMPLVGIGNGFSSQSPWASGSTSPPGLTAIDKHPYHGWDPFPIAAQVNGNLPLNGLGEPAGTRDEAGQWHELFTPLYDSFFPEYFLSAIQTETLIRDLSPYPSLIGNVEHGRFTHPPGAPPPEVWVTEVNMNPAQGPARAQLTPQDVRHIASKDALRYLVSFVNKGVTALDFYAAAGGNLALIDSHFFEAARASPSAYPGDAAGGETMTVVHRLAASLAGAVPITAPRQLSLEALTDYSQGVQFAGDGTEAYPPLYDREVFAFLPFQVNPHRFVIPVYVMTRNVEKDYRPSAPSTDPTRFDMPGQRYRMTIGGVDAADGARVTATDPLTGGSLPVKVVSGTSDSIEVEMRVTDSPRLLTIQETAPSTGVTGLSQGPVPSRDVAPGVDVAPGRADAPSVRIRSHALRGLLATRRMSVFISCPSRCDPWARGRLMAGGRAFPATPVWYRRGIVGDRATIRLAIGARAARAGRRARRLGNRVHARITAMTHVDGSASALREELRLRPPSH